MAALSSVLAGGAVAQIDSAVRQADDLDRTTLAAAQRDDWRQVAGAHYGLPDAEPGSPTSARDDLFAVSFSTARLGLVGGARCIDPAAEVEICERAPVVYEYREDELGNVSWRESLAPGAQRGYVAAITWLGRDRALAVGGDGEYPRREPADGADRAGNARAWLYDGGSWTELDTPDGMTALTAADYSLLSGFGIAGGLRQLWRFDGTAGSFTGEEIRNSEVFSYRVREIRFADEVAVAAQRRLYAVTSGCCSAAVDGEAKGRPRLLTYDFAAGRWTAHAVVWDPFGKPTEQGYPKDYQGYPENVPGHEDVDDSHGSALEQVREPARNAAGADPAQYGLPAQLSDSILSLTIGRHPTVGIQLGLVASPGGDPLPGVPESTSTIFTTEDGSRGKPTSDAARWPEEVHQHRPDLRGKTIGPIRLLGAGQDVGSLSGPADGKPDWSVGVRLDPGSPILGRGVAFATHLHPEAPVPSVDESRRFAEGLGGGDPPASLERVERARRPVVQLLSSYGVNEMEMVGGTGIGWAVGDRGAILQLSESSVAASDLQPDPPRLGSRRAASGPDTSAYDPFRPLPAGKAGQVPPYWTQTADALPRPALIPYGSPSPDQPPDTAEAENVSGIVASRDGAEAWAVGPGRRTGANQGVLTLYHFDGTRWGPCGDACSGLAPELDGFKDPVRLDSAARVPLEDDDDPANDDELEVVAVGTWERPGGRQPLLLRYSDSRWRVEINSTKQLPRSRVTTTAASETNALSHVAFTGPDEAWLAGANGGTGNVLYRSRGDEWVNCEHAEAEAYCGNEDKRLPLNYSLNMKRNLPLTGMIAAGERLYLIGARQGFGPAADNGSRSIYPMIIQRDAGGSWTADAGGDPGFERYVGPAETINPDNAAAAATGETDGAPEQGRVYSIAVAPTADGYEGWAVGSFGGPGGNKGHPFPVFGGDFIVTQTPDASLLRLEDGAWRLWTEDDAADDYVGQIGALHDKSGGAVGEVRQALALPAGEGRGVRTLLGPRAAPLLGFEGERWRAVEAPFHGRGRADSFGELRALAPDGTGGFWAAVRQQGGIYFYRELRVRHKPVFDDVAHPVRTRVGAIAGAADGRLWVGTRSNALAHYDRLTGWQSRTIEGWDAGRLVTAPSDVTAIGMNAQGQGIAVGKAGRIARIGDSTVQLDQAAGVVCQSPGTQSPCGTSHTLRAAAVAPDGSAMVGGDRLSLLWRPARGSFGVIAKPQAALSTTVTGIALPSQDRAWLTTSTGMLFAGRLDGGSWSWRQENVDSAGHPIAVADNGKPPPLRAVAVGSDGAGYAVGDGGFIIVRDPEAADPWRAVESPVREDLLSLALPVGGGDGALVGGKNGLLLTLWGGRFEVARGADPTSGLNGDVLGVAMLPGVDDEQVEAWAALDRGFPRFGAEALLHYTSDPADPWLEPAERVKPLPDVPAHRPGETVFAAFGKSDCRAADELKCPEMSGTEAAFEQIARGIVERLAARAGDPGAPAFSVFTGDVTDSAGNLDQALLGGAAAHGRWIELVAERLDAAGVPIFNAVGARDLSSEAVCAGEFSCVATEEHAKAGVNAGWRRAMHGRPGPGEGDLPSGVSRTRDGATARVLPDGELPRSRPGAAPRKLATGGARTHYALDLEPEATRGAPLRLVFADTSLRSLSSSDPVQQPIEADGQRAWLERALCVRGERSGRVGACTRSEDSRAVVVSTTPSYSHGRGVPDETLTDAAAFESTVLSGGADVVVSGRLGWNSLYWATAPGVHEPCPGGRYQDHAPVPGRRACDREDGAELEAAAIATPLADTVAPAGVAPAPPLPAVADATGTGDVVRTVPFVIASSAGGSLTSLEGEGYWHGYTVVRLDASGDPRATIVEQRPIFDWVSITAEERRLRPGQRMTLRGFGREPLAIDARPQYVRVDSPAITHRYDLVQADPERPYLPRRDADGGYVPLDPAVATVDRQSGLVKVGRGRQERAFAIAVLSVGEQAASYPLVFEPARSFKPRAAISQTIRTPARAPVTQQPPSPRLVPPPPSQVPPTPPPPPVVSPTTGSLNLPSPPSLPGLSATPGSSMTAPPAPPVPPAPPGAGEPVPLSLQAPVSAVSIVPGVIPPSPPPINPAPPGGSAARREARQRQAATAKSEQRLSDVSDAGGDLAQAPLGPEAAEMSRRDRIKPGASFTPLAHPDAGAAAGRAILYAGWLGALAFVLATGWSAGRPTPRSRTSADPATARSTRR